MTENTGNKGGLTRRSLLKTGAAAAGFAAAAGLAKAGAGMASSGSSDPRTSILRAL